ncbi:MAG: hypothetical protein FWC01_08160 [Treponema sp.]|nr:hypothetical protein [Treponema sp.]MCL2238018.1 hypothetical protein [Treponema sp.]
MLKRALFVPIFLAFLGILPCFAQNLRQARIYVPPITGTAAAEEKAFFHQKLTYEVVLQSYETARSRSAAEFILSGTTMPLEQFRSIQDDLPELGTASASGPVPAMPIPSVRNSNERREFFSWDIDGSARFFDTTGEDNYVPRAPDAESSRPRRQPVGDKVLLIELVHKEKRDTLSRGYIVYEETDAPVNEELGFILYKMLSVLPQIEEISDFRDNWLFIEASALWTPRMYRNQGSSLHLSNFGIRFAIDIQFLNFLSLGMGAQITRDWIVIGTSSIHDLILEIPLALKLSLKPGSGLMLEPYGGVSYNMSLWGDTEPSMLSWFAGLQIGIRAGPGMIVLDPRYSQDLSSSFADSVEYERFMIQVGIGYKFGLIPKRTIREY